VLDQLIISEGVAERVRIVPPVPYTELLRWTASADLGLALFRPDYSLNVRWCLPNKLFEYLMAGLPVLASPLDAVREILEAHQVGYVVEDMTPEGIAQAVNALLAEPEKLAHMRQNALELVRDILCWEKEREELLKLYEHINSSSQSSDE
jgi:glycosyltransferase involved in cell wall biosynthesis